MTDDQTQEYTDDASVKRRDFLKAAGAAGAVGGLAGCATVLDNKDKSGRDETTTPAEEDDYRCREDVLTVDIYRQNGLEHQHPEKDPEYVQEVMKEQLEDELEKFVQNSDTYNDVQANIVDEPYESKWNESYAILEGPAFDNELQELEESDEWKNHSNILLRDDTSSSLLGVAIMHDFTGKHCDASTQTCTMNYSHLVPEAEYEEVDGRELLKVYDADEQQVVNNFMANAVAPTGPHEVAHTLNITHPDGITGRIEREDSEENDIWWSSTMSAFYGLAFSLLGWENNCGYLFEPPEVAQMGFSAQILDDIYLDDEFSDCAETKFLKTSDEPDAYPRDPRANIKPDEAVDAWKESEALTEEEQEALEELWSEVGDAKVAAQNIESLAGLADNAEQLVEQNAVRDVDPEEARQRIEWFHEQVTGHLEDNGGYTPINSPDVIAPESPE
jgi:hypothetical protein